MLMGLCYPWQAPQPTLGTLMGLLTLDLQTVYANKMTYHRAVQAKKTKHMIRGLGFFTAKYQSDLQKLNHMANDSITAI